LARWSETIREQFDALDAKCDALEESLKRCAQAAGAPLARTPLGQILARRSIVDLARFIAATGPAEVLTSGAITQPELLLLLELLCHFSETESEGRAVQWVIAGLPLVDFENAETRLTARPVVQAVANTFGRGGSQAARAVFLLTQSLIRLGD
jgi:hypothetical protein